MSDYAARLRAARAYAGLTQADLAEQLGVDEQTIKRREKNGGAKRAERIAVAAVTGVPLEFIEGGWEALAAPPTDDQVRRAAALLRPALAQAGLALARAREEAQGRKDGPGRRPPAAEGGVA